MRRAHRHIAPDHRRAGIAGPRAAATGLAIAGALALGACGSSGGTGSPAAGAASAGVALPPPLAHPTQVTLILDFTPNAVHAGIYRALAEGWYRRENIELQVIEPSETSDTLRLIDAGRADFGLADGSDVAAEIAHGGDGEAVMAIAQQPLGGLIARASEHLRSPAALQGGTVGITGVPSDSAVLDTEVRAAGGDPAKVRVVNVGFNGAQALRGGQIDAFTGFWPADGVQLQVSGEGITTFKLNDWGGPPYPGLVAFTTRHLITAQPALVRDFVAATVRGYEATLRDPGASLEDLERANRGLEPRFTAASLQAYLPLFDAGGRVPFGTLQPAHIAALSRWMVAHRLIGAPVAPARYGTNAFLPHGR